MVMVMEMIKEELIPKRIRQMRLERNLTQSQLAEAIGVTKGYISMIENGDSAPSVGKLIALAQAFKVDLNAFFQTENPEVFVTVTKKNERAPVARETGMLVTYEHLALTFPKRAFETYVIKTPHATKMHSRASHHKGQEMLFVLRGKMDYNVNGHSYILEEGDSIHYNSSYPHYGTCLSEDGAEIIGVVYNDSKTDDEK
jgi:transcriptional regulator with XRE-family HTH domain